MNLQQIRAIALDFGKWFEPVDVSRFESSCKQNLFNDMDWRFVAEAYAIADTFWTEAGERDPNDSKPCLTWKNELKRLYLFDKFTLLHEGYKWNMHDFRQFWKKQSYFSSLNSHKHLSD